MADDSCIIGLDIGTTSLKAVVYATSGTQIASTSMRVDTTYDDAGAATQDAEQIYAGVLDVLKQAMKAIEKTGLPVKAIGFSSAMHSLIPLAKDGTPLGAAMTWLDARPHKEAQTLWRDPRGQSIYARTGTPVHAMAPLAKLVWLKHSEPDTFSRAKRFISIKEYVWYRWFGVFEVDHAIASATGLFDIHTFDWSDEALSYADVRPEQLSTPVATNYSRRAHEASDLATCNMPGDVVVCIGGSDGVLSNLAAGALDAQTLVLTVGTSLALRTGASRPAVDVETRSFCYVLDESHFVVGGPSNSGGVVLDWLYRNVMTRQSSDNPSDDDAQAFARLCEMAGEIGHAGHNAGHNPVSAAVDDEVDDEDLFFIPYINGERAPIWDERASGTFFGLKSYQNQTHLMRAAMEGILFNAYWIAEGLFRQVGRPKRMIVSGKLFHNAWVRRFVADLFGAQIVSEENVDGATYGAAILAAKSAQIGFKTVDNTHPSEAEVVTTPVAGRHEALVSRYRRYRTICEALRRI